MTTSDNKHLIVICGPTGSGKTDVSLTLAGHFKCPVISTDSRQIYRGMPIGTAQPGPEQLARVEHHFIASHDISEEFTCGRYEKEALELLGRLFEKHDAVVAVGGSGLYIDALCEGMDSLPAKDPELRERLVARLREKGLENLLAELEQLDPVYYEKVDRGNPVRVQRALEVCLQTGLPYSELRGGRKTSRNYRTVKIGTELPREELYRRIDRRVDVMMRDGLEAEARALYPFRELNSLQTVGYRELFEYFDGEISLDRAVELIKRNTRRYAKRQMTWFRRDGGIKWFPPDDTDAIIRYVEKSLSK